MLPVRAFGAWVETTRLWRLRKRFPHEIEELPALGPVPACHQHLGRRAHVRGVEQLVCGQGLAMGLPAPGPFPKTTHACAWRLVIIYVVRVRQRCVCVCVICSATCRQNAPGSLAWASFDSPPEDGRSWLGFARGSSLLALISALELMSRVASRFGLPSSARWARGPRKQLEHEPQSHYHCITEPRPTPGPMADTRRTQDRISVKVLKPECGSGYPKATSKQCRNAAVWPISSDMGRTRAKLHLHFGEIAIISAECPLICPPCGPS